MPIFTRNQIQIKAFHEILLRLRSELCEGSSSALSRLIKLIPGVSYAHQKKVISLDIYSILHLFWPVAGAGTQINEKKTLFGFCFGFRREADKTDKAVSEILLQAPMQIRAWAKAAQLQEKYCSGCLK